MENDEFDTILTEIAGRAGGLPQLLTAFFGFLSRRTDFYVEYDTALVNKAEMGFPKGIAEKMVLRAFKQYQLREYNPNPAVEANTQRSTTIAPPQPPRTQHYSDDIDSNNNQVLSSITPKMMTLRLTDDGKQVPIGNGGIGPNYYWNQTLKDLTVYIDVPNGCKGKDIQCKIQSKHLLLKYKNETLIDGNFEIGEGVKTGESIWTLNVSDNKSNCQVVITLDKTRNTWWKHVIDGHPEIDTTKVDSSSKIGDYDESTQGAIRKILHDQRQKSLGLPTSDELAQQELLEKYKYCPGSPFLEETKSNNII